MQQALREAAQPAILAARPRRTVPRENLHVTLAFLGSVEPERLALLDEAARRALHACRAELCRYGTSPVALRFDRLERWGRPGLLCATCEAGSLPAAALARALAACLLESGFAPDEKPFRPHVTLARDVRRAPRSALEPVVWTFDTLALIESETRPAGSLYSSRASWPLCVT